MMQGLFLVKRISSNEVFRGYLIYQMLDKVD